MTAMILAGGKALRMGGRDKAFLEIDSEPIIKRQLRRLKKIFKKVIIITNSPDRYRNFRGTKVVSDVLPGWGPLSGIHAGLLASGSFYNFVVACDMPFLNSSLINFFIANKKNYDIIIPEIDNKSHPLFGIYSKNCIPIIEKMLKKERLKVSSLFPYARVRFILRAEAEKIDKDLLSLMNVNTKEELARARSLARKKTKGDKHA